MVLNIRSYSWLRGQLSWSYVTTRLCNAFENLGHNVYPISTNGIKDTDPYFNEKKMLDSIINLQNFGYGKKAINLDFCYTVPLNFPQRFLANSKHKCAIYNFETTYWPTDWRKYYDIVDFYFPSSNFSAEIFYINGIPKEKIFVIPHGVDTKVFNSSIPAVKLNTKKKFRFISVVAAHHRKNIDTLLEAYCEAFTNEDDVCLVLKTKVYKHSDGVYDAQNNPNGRKAFEIVIGDIFKKLMKKYGKRMPEIELLNGHVENVASIYNACQCHVSTTGAEGYGMIFSESSSCGLLNILPNYSGQLDFMNSENSLLVDTKLRFAKPVEQYWTFNSKGRIGQPDIGHTVEQMRNAVKNYDPLMEKFRPNIEKMVKKLSWEYAAQLMIDATEGNYEHYKPGTYNWWPE